MKPNLNPIKPCLARELSSIHDLRGRYAVQRKYDGIRCLVHVFNGEATPFSRDGNKLQHLAPAVQHLAKLPVNRPLWFDGELVHKQGFNALLAQKNRSTPDCSQLEYIAFDAVYREELPLSEDDHGDEYPPLYERLARLQGIQLMAEDLKFAPCIWPTFPEEIKEYTDLFKFSITSGWEGLMLKKDTPYSPWRTDDWLKHKPIHNFALSITGFKEGKGRYAGMLGAFECEDRMEDLRVCVSAGLDAETRKTVWQNKKHMLHQMIEVAAASISQNAAGGKSLRHPVFVSFLERVV